MFHAVGHEVAYLVVLKLRDEQFGAELLHQPVLLDYFERRLSTLKPKYKANPIVTRVQKGILEIRPLIGLTDDAEISEKSVGEINRITSELTKSINSKAP